MKTIKCVLLLAGKMIYMVNLENLAGGEFIKNKARTFAISQNDNIAVAKDTKLLFYYIDTGTRMPKPIGDQKAKELDLNEEITKLGKLFFC